MADTRIPSFQHLEDYAREIRRRYPEPVWGEPDIVRWSRQEPKHVVRYVILCPTGRLWRIIDTGE